jgi:hypothetical protein
MVIDSIIFFKFNLLVEKTRGKLAFFDGGYAIVDINSPIIPTELELGDRRFRLTKEQDDDSFWLYVEKPPYRIDLH